MKARIVAIALLAFLGMTDALYLSMTRDGAPIPCRVTSGCDDVLTSSYSELAGIPISWFGFAFYFTAFGCAVFAGFGNERLLDWMVVPAATAFAVSVFLTAVQVFLLRAYCEYCLASGVLVTAIFLLTLMAVRRRRRT